MNIKTPLALVLLALVGCTGEVSTESSTTGAGGGQTGAGGGQTGAGGGQTTGAGGAGGGGSACAVLSENGVTWSIEFSGGEHLDPSVTKTDKIGDVREETFDGEVVDVSPGHLTIDTCPPNADCAGTLVKIDVAMKVGAFDIGIPLQTFVHVHLVSTVVGYTPGGQTPYRTLLLQIDNLATWGGVPSAIEPGSDLWLIASDAGLPVYEKAVGALGVSNDKTCAFEGSSYYSRGALTFWDLATPGTKVTLQHGESGSLATTVSKLPLMITNVDSSIEFNEGAWAPDFLVRRAHLED